MKDKLDKIKRNVSSIAEKAAQVQRVGKNLFEKGQKIAQKIDTKKIQSGIEITSKGISIASQGAKIVSDTLDKASKKLNKVSKKID